MIQTYCRVQQKQLRKLSARSHECGERHLPGRGTANKGEEAGKVVVFGIVKRYGDVKHTHCQPRSGSHPSWLRFKHTHEGSLYYTDAQTNLGRYPAPAQ
ncbi:hypothetical protein [Ralstonia syzygii]|uniref:hypothetical protein n=1 Tax=Ralstonia syzygii TaxID=28097 RepID=UPI0018D11932|nr:hypothetical protein [Ralstonia syzygii]